MRTRLAALAAVLVLLPSLAAAQSGMISAADTAGMATALGGAGYSVTAGVDAYGDPLLVDDLLGNERLISIGLDEEGDPWVTWDVVTLGGNSAEMFLQATDQFSAEVELVATTVFAEQEAGN